MLHSKAMTYAQDMNWKVSYSIDFGFSVSQKYKSKITTLNNRETQNYLEGFSSCVCLGENDKWDKNSKYDIMKFTDLIMKIKLVYETKLFYLCMLASFLYLKA